MRWGLGKNVCRYDKNVVHRDVRPCLYLQKNQVKYAYLNSSKDGTAFAESNQNLNPVKSEHKDE